MAIIKAPQTEAFLKGEGDAWHQRNIHKPRHDTVTPHIIALDLQPTQVVEFGCGNGWRFDQLSKIFPAAHFLGVDPSREAIEEARRLYGNANVEFIQGTADFPAMQSANLIIYGFCLYLADRSLLQRIVYEADAMLSERGHIIIHDFYPVFPQKVPYHHKNGLWTYKMDYSQLWLGNPAYSLVAHSSDDDDTGIWVLEKDTVGGWPCA